MSEIEKVDEKVIAGKENIKKKCFIITPIGSDDSEIRRHIEGIIDQAIIPAIGEKYEIEVAHRDCAIGSINDKVIRSVYDSDLVIANLTSLNPNVMFELAIRYSFGKPAIVIAEKNTKLPFDITDERTIFYVNDPKGAFDLKEAIIKFEANIDYNNYNYGPVYKSISKIPLYSAVESGENISNKELMTYLLDRLDTIEENLKFNRTINSPKHIKGLEIFYDDYEDIDPNKIISELNKLLINVGLNMNKVIYLSNGIQILFDYRVDSRFLDSMKNEIISLLYKNDITNFTIKPIEY